MNNYNFSIKFITRRDLDKASYEGAKRSINVRGCRLKEEAAFRESVSYINREVPDRVPGPPKFLVVARSKNVGTARYPRYIKYLDIAECDDIRITKCKINEFNRENVIAAIRR